MNNLYKDYAAKLADNGYIPFAGSPIEATAANFTTVVTNSVVAGQEQHTLRAPSSDRQCGDAGSVSGESVGIQTGAGKFPLVVISINVTNESHLAIIENVAVRKFGKTQLIRRTKGSGILLVYRSHQPLASSSHGTVNILAENCSFTVFAVTAPGCQHDWSTGKGDPTNIPASEPPLITEEMLVDFIKELNSKIILQHDGMRFGRRSTAIESQVSEEFADPAVGLDARTVDEQLGGESMRQSGGVSTNNRGMPDILDPENADLDKETNISQVQATIASNVTQLALHQKAMPEIQPKQSGANATAAVLPFWPHATKLGSAPLQPSGGPPDSSEEVGDDSDPLPLISELAAPADYPSQALGPLLGPAVEEIAKLIQVPTAICANSALAAASLAVQGIANIEHPQTKQAVPLSLFLLTIAESGDRKSTTDKMFLKAKSEYEDSLSKKEELAKKMAATAKREDKTPKIASKPAPATDQTKTTPVVTPQTPTTSLDVVENQQPPKGDNLDKVQKGKLADFDLKPTSVSVDCDLDPFSAVVTTGNITTESLFSWLKRSVSSVGVMSSEGAKILGGHSMKAENKAAMYGEFSEIWDGAHLVRMRAMGGEISNLRGRRICLHLMVQPIIAPLLIGDAVAKGQGFANRFLIASPESLAGSRFIALEELGKDLQTPFLDAFNDAGRGIFARPYSTASHDKRELVLPSIKLSKEATSAWGDYYNFVEKQQRPGGKYHSVKGFASKLAEHALRLAGVMALMANLDVGEVGVIAMTDAIKLAEFYGSEAIRLFGIVAPDADLAMAQVLIDWIQAKGLTSFTRRHITQYGPNAMRETRMASRILSVLVEHKHLQISRVGNNGILYTVSRPHKKVAA